MEINNGVLLKWMRQIIEADYSDVYTLALKGRLSDIHKAIDGRHKTLMAKIVKLEDGYFQKDENKQLIMEAPAMHVEGEKQNPPKPKMIEGKLFEDYEKEFSELMKEKITVNI